MAGRPDPRNFKIFTFKKLLQFGVLNKIDQNVDFFQNVKNFGKNKDLVSSRHRDIDFQNF